MSKALIIVESPAKIKTLQKILGPKYVFASSYGHIRDLPGKGFGIDVEANFEPTYEILPDKKKVIDELKSAAKKCDLVYLSPDPDREGEAIAWHIAAILPKDTKYVRATFHSITKEAVMKALETPRDIDLALVDAQQARRLLDRIVGYKISPILARRVQGGKDRSLSAGRVQSVALKLVVDREKEIMAFKPVEYWSIQAEFKTKDSPRSFVANLFSIHGKKLEKEPQADKECSLLNTEEEANRIVSLLERGHFVIKGIDRKEKRRHAEAPFITSTMQQEASRHLGFSVSKTMTIAQSLYEGIEMGKEGAEGLITYMRTDSVRSAPEAIFAARDWVLSRFGKDYLPLEPRLFSSKKTAQDAHEAIRPTNLNHPPEVVAPFLTHDQLQLYTLIWKRFVASQMASAIYDTVSVDIECDQNLLLRATGSHLKFPGYLSLYQEKQDDEEEEEDKLLPDIEEGQPLNLLGLKPEQSFTRPPPRFTEASLVKELEKSGIGRPSTYAAIMQKIQGREYTVKEAGRLKPTELGIVTAEMLEANFSKIMDIRFTSHMEDELEDIAEEKMPWKAVVKEFWDEFIPVLEEAEKNAFVPKVPTDIPCPKCGEKEGGKLQKIWFRSKYFYGCNRYPDCDFSSSQDELHFDKEKYHEEFNWNQPCPICNGPMKIRHGKFGAFLGCANFPNCKGIINIPKKGEESHVAEEMPSCPAIGCDGKMVARRSRFGKVFYSCSTFPDCDVIVNDLSQLEEKYVNHPKTAYVSKSKFKGKKKETAKKEPAKKETSKKTKASTKAAKKTTTAKKKETKPKVSKLLKLSDELSHIVGEKELPRQEVLKKVWDYIRSNNLQDPKDKRRIQPDSKLSEVVKTKEAIGMFELPKLLGPHMGVE